MPATRATGMAMPAGSSPQQQPPDERGDKQQRQSGSHFGDSGEDQHLFHLPRLHLAFRVRDAFGNAPEAAIASLPAPVRV
jgi:hypothetical protein